jgi:type II secretory pathway pseudopilin PulG
MFKLTQKILASVANFKKDQRGVAAIIGAVVLPAVMGTVGLAVDTTRYYRAKQVIIEAADAAALAAASVDIDASKGESREAIASKFFMGNIPSDYKSIVDLKSFKFTDAGQKNGAVIVNYTVEAGIKPLVAQVVGVGYLNMSHEGTAVREIQSLEVVLTLPMNGTMCSVKERTPIVAGQTDGDTLLALKPDPACKHFNAMKDGAKAFSDTLFDNQTVSRLKIGLVPYNIKVKMPDVRNIPPLMLQNELTDDLSKGPGNEKIADPTFFENMENTGILPPVTSLTTDRNKINTAIRELEQTPQGIAWSRTNLPTLTAGLMLDASQSQYFMGEIPEAFDNTFVQKVIVLMTDGSNIGCCQTNLDGKFSKDTQYVYFHKPDVDQQLLYCKLLKEQNVKIYSIIFDVKENDAGGKQTNNLFARCASGSYSEPSVNPDDDRAELKCRMKQNCYNVSDDKQLVKVFKDIAQNFFISRTSK